MLFRSLHAGTIQERITSSEAAAAAVDETPDEPQQPEVKKDDPAAPEEVRQEVKRESWWSRLWK